MPPDDAIRETLANARRALLDVRGPDGHWEGELSSSALSTATAVFTLSLHGRAAGGTDARRKFIAAGLRWLLDTQNPDGGWGDTTLSFSNISTTALCWAVLNIPEAADFCGSAKKAEDWLRAAA